LNSAYVLLLRSDENASLHQAQGDCILTAVSGQGLRIKNFCKLKQKQRESMEFVIPNEVSPESFRGGIPPNRKLEIPRKLGMIVKDFDA